MDILFAFGSANIEYPGRRAAMFNKKYLPYGFRVILQGFKVWRGMVL